MRTREEVANDFRRDLAELMLKHSVTNIRGYYEWTISGRDTYSHKIVADVTNFLPGNTTENVIIELPWEILPEYLVDTES